MTRRPQRSEAPVAKDVGARDDLVASPPDDGGHLGDLTLPEHTMQRTDTGPRKNAPPLDSDITEQPPESRSPEHLWLVVAVTVAVVLLFVVLGM
ncbi:MAG TPA: hypothetical protein VFG83_07710 [Kofleriaceae bacterium]|nr:hypothetical protein [Kofleriaceae bacterium]